MIPTKVAEVSPGVPRQAVPIAIDATLTTFDDPATKLRIEHMLASPGMKAIERELIAGIADGSLGALGDPERTKRIGAMTSRYADAVVDALARDVGPRIAPAAASTMHAAVKGAMDEALSPEHRKDMSLAVTGAIDEIGPALKKALDESITPAIGSALNSEELRRGLGDLVHVLAREAVLGASEALAEKTKDEPHQGGGSLIDRVTNLAGKGIKLAGVLTWVLGFVVILLGIWIARLVIQGRRYRSDAEKRATAGQADLHRSLAGVALVQRALVRRALPHWQRRSAHLSRSPSRSRASKENGAASKV